MPTNKNVLQPRGQLDFLTQVDKGIAESIIFEEIRQYLPYASIFILNRVLESMAQFGGRVGQTLGELVKEDSQASKQ